MQPLLYLACTVTLAAASWDANLNFRSPSHSHDLGVDLPKVAKRQDSPDYFCAQNLSFTHGVASGDPYPDSVILWTRAAPTTENNRSNATVSGAIPLYDHRTEEYVANSRNPICVDYLVSENQQPDAGNAVHAGRVLTSSDIDFTIKVEADGLKPWTQYYYKFEVCDSAVSSPIGRTRTAPHPDDDVDSVSLAVFSCADFSQGFFNAYGNAARKDEVNFVIHLGDYIYESDSASDERAPLPRRELYTLYDYRARIASHRTDSDLLLSHQKHAWIPVWDDHEVADNSYRDGSSFLNNTEESFRKSGGVSVDQRKMNAVRAYFEWMPIRQVDMDDNLRIWRSFSLGKLVDLIMLDTRAYDRSIPPLLGQGNDAYIEQIKDDASRTLMGGRQEKWFYNKLIDSSERGATWRLIGNQIVFSHIGSSKGLDPVDGDAWDGYVANRNRTLKTIVDHQINNTIMLSGDSHANWVADIAWIDGPGQAEYSAEDGTGAIGVEFAGTAVTAPSIVCSDFEATDGPPTLGQAACDAVSSGLVRDNPVLQWSEGYYRGYYQVHVDAARVEARYFGIPTVTRQLGWEVSLANFTVESGANRLRRPLGAVEDGAVRGNELRSSNLTRDTADTARGWFTHHEESMYLNVSGGLLA